MKFLLSIPRSLVADHHRLHVVWADLLEQAGDRAGARREWREALRRVTSQAERRHLERRLRALG